MDPQSQNKSITNTSNSSRRAIILGHGNSFHDPSVALMSGDRIFAEGIERHTQCKRAMEVKRLWYSERPLKKALALLGLWPVTNADIYPVSGWDLDRVIQGAEELGNVNLWREVDPKQFPFYIHIHALASEPIFIKQMAAIIQGDPPDSAWVSLPIQSRDSNVFHPSAMVSHHLAHAANAVFTSPFEQCAAMVVDGYGENGSLALFHFRDNQLTPIEVPSHSARSGSLGRLYMQVTSLCGFDAWKGEEWKVMGLAAYGHYDKRIFNYFRDRIEVEGFNARIAPLDDGLETLLGGFRAPDDPDFSSAAILAHNFQKCFEDVVIELARNAGKMVGSKNLTLSGGCALNSSANGKILQNTDFEALHIPCAPADDGNSLGAALYQHYAVLGNPREPRVLSPFLGSRIDSADLEKILGFGGIHYQRAEDEKALCERVATLLADGGIVGWAQGRAEFGPRALGNRSILAHPGLKHMKDRINRLVKFREQFRPMAPAILDEYGPDYFENYQKTPYMERTLPFRAGMKDKVPAVVHEDGTGRLQTVTQELNPLFYRLIRAFHEKTGIPLLLNTSLNVMGKPIVHSAEDCIAVLFTTGMDIMVIGKYLLSKTPISS